MIAGPPSKPVSFVWTPQWREQQELKRKQQRQYSSRASVSSLTSSTAEALDGVEERLDRILTAVAQRSDLSKEKIARLEEEIQELQGTVQYAMSYISTLGTYGLEKQLRLCQQSVAAMEAELGRVHDEYRERIQELEEQLKLTSREAARHRDSATFYKELADVLSADAERRKSHAREEWDEKSKAFEEWQSRASTRSTRR